MTITLNINKAKAIAHTIRRSNRDQAFAPFDAIIAKQIPEVIAGQAESRRQAIRDADAARQASIDAATTLTEIQMLLKT